MTEVAHLQAMVSVKDKLVKGLEGKLKLQDDKLKLQAEQLKRQDELLKQAEAQRQFVEHWSRLGEK